MNRFVERSYTTRKVVTIDADTAAEINDYRFSNRITTEAEALRQLIEAGLKAVNEAQKEGVAQ